ncbi:MAG: protein-arginine deiminase family protein [Microcoleaceae cyanobacterium]
MGWIRYITVILVNAVGAVVGVVLIPFSPVALAQDAPTQNPAAPNPISDSTLNAVQFSSSTLLSLEASQAQSLTELYQLQQDLQTEIETLNLARQADSPVEAWQSDLQRQQLQDLQAALRQVEARIPIEEQANQTWKDAAAIAQQAVIAGDSQVGNWAEAQQLWTEAIATLRKIPPDTFLSQAAIEKIVQYQGNLATVTYKYVTAPPVAEPEPQAETPALSPTPSSEVAPQTPGFELYGDANRDGSVNQADQLQPQQWSLVQGPLMLFNNDDDNRDAVPDWQDQDVNGKSDSQDLAPIHFKLSDEYADTQLFVTTDSLSRDRVNLFQKVGKQWQKVDLSGQTPLIFSRNVVLGIEAKQFADKDWQGLVQLQAIAQRDGQPVATASVEIGVTPWVMSPKTAKVSEVHISDRATNQTAVDQVKAAAEQSSTVAKVISGGTNWMQDTAEIGYVQFPGQGQTQSYPVVLEGKQQKSDKSYAKSLLSRDQGWFDIGQSRQLEPLNQSLDSYSNLGVTPPLPGYPMGRVYYGKAEGETLHPDVVAFLKAQKVQGTPVEIDTSWLLIRHVDEIINFVPSQTGEPLMLVASPEDGVQVLEDIANQGYGMAELNRGLSTETTVQSALNNQLLIQHNLDLQQKKVDPLVRKLKQEFGLKDEQIVRVPLLFGYTGYSWWPNLINAIYLNRRLLAPNPKGPLVDGRDYLQEEFKRRLAIADAEITFLNDDYYQDLKGNLQTGTNTVREAPEQPFWEAFSTTPAQ